MRSIALFWDQSFLWGFFVYDALNAGNLAFDIISASDIQSGKLKDYRLLIVPGGWASQKIELLGKSGALEIQRFLHNGGRYIGLCGGAGMVLSGSNGLGIVPVERLPFKERLPSASGGVTIEWTATRKGLLKSGELLNTSIWWPAQFKLQNNYLITVLAVYKEIGSDFWVADVPFSDTCNIDISKIEALYGINLDPYRYLIGRPAIIEGEFGKGKLFLSYPHLETPGNSESRKFFLKLIDRYTAESSVVASLETGECAEYPYSVNSRHTKCIARMIERINELVDYGIEHFLWYWRKPWLLGWKRGLRGLEYSMLSTSFMFLYRSFQVLESDAVRSTNNLDEELSVLENLVEDFCHKAMELLEHERFFIARRLLPKLGSVDERIDSMREYLFGTGMNHGGLCKQVFDRIDRLLFFTIKQLNYRNLKMFFMNDKNDFIAEGA